MPSLSQQLFRRIPLEKPSGHHTGQELERSMGTFQLMMLGVGCTIGTGIFFVLQEAVPEAGPAVIISFLIAGLAAGLSALCYAELASAIPISGSTYSYAYHALGEFPAMLVAGCVVLEYGVSSSAVAVGWSGYFNELLQNTVGWRIPDALSYSPISDGNNPTGQVNLLAIALVFMCALLLMRGTSESARVNTVMVLIKLAVLGMFIVIGLTGFDSDHFGGFWDAGAAGISTAAGTIFFSFIGLDAVSTAGEEVRNPQKALPRAIIGALIIVVSVYVLVALAGVGAQPAEAFSDPEQQSAGLSVILENITGSSLPATVLAAGAVISIFSVTLVCFYGQTRILFAMGRDGLLPRRFSKVNPRTMVPTFNTVVVAVVAALIAGFIPAGYLWDTISIGTLMAFSTVAIGIIVLRVREPELERPFKVPGYPVTPILTVAACVYVMSGLHGVTWLIFGVWILVVVVFYLAWGRRHAALNRQADGETDGSMVTP